MRTAVEDALCYGWIDGVKCSIDAARYTHIAWINAAKRTETKQRRVNEAVALLSRGAKLGMR